jgi:hypothetical protein
MWAAKPKSHATQSLPGCSTEAGRKNVATGLIFNNHPALRRVSAYFDAFDVIENTYFNLEHAKSPGSSQTRHRSTGSPPAPSVAEFFVPFDETLICHRRDVGQFSPMCHSNPQWDDLWVRIPKDEMSALTEVSA